MNDWESFTKITANGDKYWYENGQLHRENGPAIEYTDGRNYWMQNGKYHRTDGPAIEWSDGINFWYIDGKEYSFQEWLTKCSLTNEEKIEMVLCYG